MQDQLPGLAGAASQLDARAGGKGLRVKAQLERQRLVGAVELGAGQQLLRPAAFIDHQQGQLDLGTGRHAQQGAAQFALIRRQGAKPGLLRPGGVHHCRLGCFRRGLVTATGNEQAGEAEHNERSK
ncbi:hypothetical protein D3C85_847650 [compost metagenome]